MKLTFFGRVDKDGVLKIANRKQMDNSLLSLSGKAVEITIERQRKKRSSQANRYYWGVVVPAIQYELSRVSGEPVSTITCHELLKQRYNSTTVINPNGGEAISVPKSSTELTTTEWELFMDECRKFAAEFFDVFIPLPNEQASLMIAEHDQEEDIILITGDK